MNQAQLLKQKQTVILSVKHGRNDISAKTWEKWYFIEYKFHYIRIRGAHGPGQPEPDSGLDQFGLGLDM